MGFIEKTIETLSGIVNTLADVFFVSPFDILIISLLFGMLVGFGFQYGKRHIITLLLTAYLTTLLYIFFPYTEKILEFESDALPLTAIIIATFTVLFLALYVLFIRMVHISFPLSSGKRWLEVLLIGFVGTTFIIALLYHIIPLEAVYDFSPPIDRFFESTTAFFWWLVAPLVVLLVLGKGDE